MYVPTPGGTENIDITYKGNLIGWLLFAISLLSLALAFFYLAVPQFFHWLITRHSSFLKNIVGKKMEKILADELA